LLTQHTIIEQVLGELPMAIAFLRPAWFMEIFAGMEPKAIISQ
jgi:hypothetical protein